MMRNELTKCLGGLERDVMMIMWKKKNATVREVINEMNKKKMKKTAYTTLMTVMARLYFKKILDRKIVGDTYHYWVLCDKEEFLRVSIRRVIRSMLKECGRELTISEIKKFINKN